MSALNLEAFSATPLVREPFDYLIQPGFIKPEALARINEDFPVIEQPGSFPLSEVRYGSAFRDLIDELEGGEVRAAFAQKFGLDLDDRPTMITVRGRCGERDGGIHTDTASKLITVLIYMNPTWEVNGGRLRLLRSGTDLKNVIVEVPPLEGTLLTFRRCDNSWHGHEKFVGERRVIQLNWVTSRSVVRREQIRHRFSAWMKRLLPAKRSPERKALPAGI